MGEVAPDVVPVSSSGHTDPPAESEHGGPTALEQLLAPAVAVGGFLNRRALVRATRAVPRTLQFVGNALWRGEVSESLPAPHLSLGLAAQVAMDEALLAMAMAPNRFPCPATTDGSPRSWPTPRRSSAHGLGGPAVDLPPHAAPAVRRGPHPQPRVGARSGVRAGVVGERVRPPRGGAGLGAVDGIRAQRHRDGGAAPPRDADPALGDRRPRVLHGVPLHGLPGPACPPAPPRARCERRPAGPAPPRRPPGHPGERRAVPLLRAHERRARPDPGRLGRPTPHRLDPVPGRHLHQPVRRVARRLHRRVAGRPGAGPRRRGGRHPGRRLPRAVPRTQPPSHPGTGDRAPHHGRHRRERLPRGVTTVLRPAGGPRPPLHLRRLRRPTGHTRPGAAPGRALGRSRGVVVRGQPRGLHVVRSGHRIRRGVAGRGGRDRVPRDEAA